MGVEFKPSDVVLTGVPLGGTLGRSEVEFAAAIIVRTCQANGDTWTPVGRAEMAAVLHEDVETKREPVASWDRNPFLHPDFRDLVARGLAAWIAPHPDSRIQMTEKGLVALQPWVKSSVGHRG